MKKFACCLLHVWLTFQPWIWRQHVPLKGWLTFKGQQALYPRKENESPATKPQVFCKILCRSSSTLSKSAIKYFCSTYSDIIWQWTILRTLYCAINYSSCFDCTKNCTKIRAYLGSLNSYTSIYIPTNRSVFCLDINSTIKFNKQVHSLQFKTPIKSTVQLCYNCFEM
jgi:hypothetical protein